MKKIEKGRKITFGVIFALVAMVCIIAISFEKNQQKKEIVSKLELNPLPMSADEYDIESVELKKNVKDELKKEVSVYQVKAKDYSLENVKDIAKAGLGKTVKEFDERGNEITLTLSEDDIMYYYKNSGTIHYISNALENSKQTITDKLSDKEYRNIAELFIKNTKIYDMNDLEFVNVRAGNQIEYAENEGTLYDIDYEVTYKKKAPEGIDGFEGTGPGIKISINNKGEISGFISVNKEIKKINTKYEAKDIKEIEQDIVTGNNVQMRSDGTDNLTAEFDKMEYVLYCDPADEEQKYMVPHYKLGSEGEEQALEVIIPAVKNSQIKLKSNISQE